MGELRAIEAAEPLDVEGRLEEIAAEIEAIQASAVIRIGERLHAARELHRYKRDEGGFAGWAESRLKFSRSTAYKIIGVYETLGESVHVDGHIPRQVLYELASAPAEVCDPALERINAGDVPSAQEIRRLADENKAAQKRIEGLEARNAELADAVSARAKKAAPVDLEAIRADARAAVEAELRGRINQLSDANVAAQADLKRLRGELQKAETASQPRATAPPTRPCRARPGSPAGHSRSP